MLNRRTWLKLGASFAFLTAATYCVVVSFQVLCNKHDEKAGIITFNVRDIFFCDSGAVSLLIFILQFNFANVHLPDNPLVFLRAVSGRDIIPVVPSEARSVASGVATAVSSVTSQAKSVASAVTTVIPDADAIIPQNLSLGTKQFCVGFSNRIECNKLPVNTSEILPKALMSAVGDQVEDFHRLDGILTILSPEYIKDSFIFGLVATTVMAIMFVCSIFGQHFRLVRYQQDLPLLLILRLMVGLICCVSFLIPTIILYTLYSKSKGLPSNIKVNEGDVGGYCLGAFFSAIFMTVLITFIGTFIEHCVA